MDLRAAAQRARRVERAGGVDGAAGQRRCGCATRRSSGRPAARSTATGRGRTRSAAYLLLDSLALREETSGLARFLFEDFAHYFTSRKPRDQFALLIVDEFSALAHGAGMAAQDRAGPRLQHEPGARPAGRRGDGRRPSEAAADPRHVETVICHRVNTPEEIIALAGTRRAMEYSTHYAEEGATGEGSARIQHQFKVDPNKVRALAPGHGVRDQPRPRDEGPGPAGAELTRRCPSRTRREPSWTPGRSDERRDRQAARTRGRPVAPCEGVPSAGGCRRRE